MLTDNTHVQKIAILGDSATQYINKFILKNSKNKKFEILDFDIDQIENQIYNSNSELYEYKPDFIIIFQSTQKLQLEFSKLSNHSKQQFASENAGLINQLYHEIQSRVSCKVLWNNFYEINDGIYGNYANNVTCSFLSQLRKLNVQISELAIKHGNLFIYDLSLLQTQIGANTFLDNRMYVLAGMAISIAGMENMSNELLSIISAINGSIKKCLILDLDNTLWGGIIGDDGIENIQIGNLGVGKAFTQIQHWAKELKNRGIILAICSKNNEKIALEPFKKHPDMVLKLTDIAIFVANWNNKVDNIRHIQEVLNVGFDSMVFIDDNLFERNMVRESISDICVPELPDDPSEYLPFLQSQNLFETASISMADSDRTEQYQAESKRVEIKKSFKNEGEYLESLQMKAIVEAANKFTIPRIAQLTQRSNQFNLRTQRYTNDNIESFMESGNHEVLTFSLADKFSDYGLVSVIILEKKEKQLFIDTWIMSCRVLKRGLEKFILNKLVTFAYQNNFTHILGEFIPTKKNLLVEHHYRELGFKKSEGLWKLGIEEYSQKKVFIT
ncbi:MAG: HAD family hydrolase [Salinivirgaceae bacterium]|nr:HAD family hydrolase [Salinivirgaceae bacterium]